LHATLPSTPFLKPALPDDDGASIHGCQDHRKGPTMKISMVADQPDWVPCEIVNG
jgi:hypothetical protein